MGADDLNNTTQLNYHHHLNNNTDFAEYKLSSLLYYDELVKLYNESSIRKGNLRVLPSVSEGDFSEVAICNFASLLAFTDGETPVGESDNFAAYENAAAIALAIQHLNTGDGIVVKQVNGLPNRCNIRFTTDLFDTTYAERYAVDVVIQETDHEFAPCAFLGAERSAVSIPTAIITGLRGYPQVSAFSTSPALKDSSQYPLFGRTIPSDDATAIPVILYIRNVLNVRYLGVAYVNDSYGTSFMAGLQAAAQEYAPDLQITSVDFPYSATDAEIDRAVSVLKTSEYRYFFAIIMGRQNMDRLLKFSFEKGIAGTGKHTWLFADASFGDIVGRSFDISSITTTRSSSSSTSDDEDEGDDNSMNEEEKDSDDVSSSTTATISSEWKIYKALQGSGLISASPGIPGKMPLLDNFMKRHQELDNDMDLSYLIDKAANFLNKKSASMSNFTAVDVIKARPQFANLYCPWLYDSVIALGLAACNALDANKKNETYYHDNYFTGMEHFDAFKALEFESASGFIEFDHDSGSRVPTSSHFVLLNFISNNNTPKSNNNNNHTVMFQDIQSGIFDDQHWKELTPFIFSDGTTIPHPDLPPLHVEDNLLTPGWRAAGLVMCTIALALALGLTIWTWMNRHSRVVCNSQPIFLHLICLGVFIFVSSIIPLSYDQGIANIERCTVACTSFIWLISLGFCITFSALFTKTYRVNIIVSQPQFKRIKVTAWDVAWPMTAILAINVLILSLMTAISPLSWVVSVVSIDNFGRSTETHGYCDWSSSVPYLAPLAVINFSCLAFAVIQAYAARRVSTELHESEYIFKCMLVILLACFLAFPVLVLVKENAVAFYFVLAATIAISGGSILGLIFVPKILYLRRTTNNQSNNPNNNKSRSRTIITISNENGKNGDTSIVSSVNDDISGIRILNHPRTEEMLRAEIRELQELLRNALQKGDDCSGDCSSRIGMGGISERFDIMGGVSEAFLRPHVSFPEEEEASGKTEKVPSDIDTDNNILSA